MSRTPEESSNPYKGASAFEAGETIYGRDRETAELLDLVIAERIVLLHSPSGAGKTSLIQAGLVPALEKARFEVLPIMRVNHEPPPEIDSSSKSFNRYIYSALLSLEEARPAEQRFPGDKLFGMTLADYLEGTVSTNKHPSRVLIFDQFEEILTVNPTDKNAKEDFFKQVGDALSNRRCWALFSMREDYAAALSPYTRWIPTRLTTTYRLDLLDVEAARPAIQRPALAGGVVFHDDATDKLIDDLRIVRVQGADGKLDKDKGPYVEPVQLQVVCYRLWEKLSSGVHEIKKEDIETGEDVNQALGGYYAERVKNVADETGISERTIREWFNRALITEQGLRGQVLRTGDNNQGLGDRAIWLLVNDYLVRAEKRRGTTWFELAHDRLIEPVQNNNALWFEANLNDFQRQAELWERERRPDRLLLHDQALEKAEEWVQQHKDGLTLIEEDFLEECRQARTKADREREQLKIQAERERRDVLRYRRLAYIATIVSIIAVLLLLTSIGFAAAARRATAYAETQRQKAVEQQQEAENLRQVAEGEKKEAVRQREFANKSAAESVEQRKIAEERGKKLEVALGVAEAKTREAYQQRRLAEASAAEALRQAEIAKKNEQQAQLAKAEVERQKGQVEVQRASAVAEAESKRQLLYVADMNLARQAYEDNNIVRGRDLLETHDGADAHTFEWRYLWRLFHQESDTLFVSLLGPEPLAFSVSQDGTTLAAAAADDNLVLLWGDSSSDDSKPVEPAVGQVNALALSPDNKLLAVAGTEPTVKLIDVGTQREVAALAGHTDAVNSVAFSPDGRVLATGGNDHTLRLWDVAARKELAKLDRSSYVRAVAFTPDGREVGAGHIDGEVVIWDIASRGVKRVFRHDANVVSLAFSSYGGLLATASKDGVVKLWVYPTGTELHRFTGDGKTPVGSVAFSADGKELVIGYDDGTLRLADVNTDNPLRVVIEERAVLKGHQDPVRAAAFAPGGRLITGSDDLTFKFWDVKARVLQQSPFKGHASEVTAVAFSPAGGVVASASGDKTVRVWRADTREEVCTIKGSAGAFRSVAFSPDGRVLATGSEVETGGQEKSAEQASLAALWDAGTCTRLAALGDKTKPVTSVAFSPDGRLLATAARGDANITLWDTTTFKEVKTLHAFQSVLALAFSPDGLMLAAGDDGGGLWLWDVANEKVLKRITTGAWWVGSLAFSPAQSGRSLLAAGIEDGEVKVWDLGAGQMQELATLEGHKAAVASVAFSSDGRVLSSGSRDSTIKLWGMDSFKELMTLKGHEGAVNSVAFSSDGRVLASGSFDRTVRLWHAATDEEVKKEAGKFYGIP